MMNEFRFSVLICVSCLLDYDVNYYYFFFFKNEQEKNRLFDLTLRRDHRDITVEKLINRFHMAHRVRYVLN